MDNLLPARKRNIAMTMFWYWIIVIVWQWVRPVENRSLIDSLVKVGAFAIILVYAQRRDRKTTESNWLIWMVLFLSTQVITVMFDSGDMTSGALISIAFIFIQIMVFLVLLSDDEVYESEVEKFCKFLVIVGMIMAIYNMIFERGRFIQAFSSGGGRYGSECKSFLYSNHEFGIYLANSIISLFWLTLRGKAKFWVLFVCGAVLGANLISTYSRTAILGTVAAVFILLFFYKKNVFAAALFIFAIAVAIIYLNPTTRAIIFDKILKGTFENGQIMDDNRSTMYQGEFELFKTADTFKQFFGYGYAGREKFEGHNGYLQILLTGGITMFVFFIGIIIVGFKYSLKVVMVNKSLGSLMLGYQIFSLLYMIAQTAVLFYSTMDSFFITMTAILIPKYVYNHVMFGSEEETHEDNSA